MNNITKGSLNKISSDSFLTYALEVIKGRAIPNVEDNLKPVHRRVLFSMAQMKLSSDAKTKKSATVVGETMKIHPHGDSSIYDALVRLSQPWKMRYPLVEIQGNGGSITGSPAAASRYTETRLSPIGDLMLKNFKQGIEMKPTYDEEGKEPRLLPSEFPNILCNGTMGIAVGMSSSLLPHNLKEAADAIIAYVNNPNLTIDELLKIMPGPDLPTGAIIPNADKIKEIYTTGSGGLYSQAKFYIETKGKNTHVVFTEVPYLVEIDNIISQIKNLAIEGELEDVAEIENNTGRNGIEIRVILKPKTNTNKVIQTLMDKTSLKNLLRISMTVLEGEKPKQTNIFGLISGYINHRHQVLVSIAKNDLQKAEDRLHIVAGMIIATQDIDGVVDIVKNANSRDAAKTSLMKQYKLTIPQADAILDMRLSQISRIDAYKLSQEAKTLSSEVEKYSKIINSSSEREKIIIKTLEELKDKYGDSRRTILKKTEVEDNEVVIENKVFLVTLNKDNTIAVTDVETLAQMGRGKVGKKILKDTPVQAIQINSRSSMLVITKSGQSVSIPASKLFVTDGVHIQDLDSRIVDEVVLIKELTDNDLNKEFLTIQTKNGLIKKSLLSEYNNFKTLIYAIKLKEGDEVVFAATHNDDEFIVMSSAEKTLKYPLSTIRSTGRYTIGVISHDIGNVYGIAVGKENDKVMIFDVSGAGKIVLIKDYMDGVRGGKGQVIREDNIGMAKLSRSNIVLIGKDLKGYLLDINDVDIKTPKTNNILIYNGTLLKIGE